MFNFIAYISTLTIKDVEDTLHRLKVQNIPFAFPCFESDTRNFVYNCERECVVLHVCYASFVSIIMSVYISFYESICVYVCICECIYMCARAYAHLCICVHMCAYSSMYVRTCVHIYE